MEWTVIVEEIFRIVLIPLLGILVKYFIQFINLKTDEWKSKKDDALYQKYITMLNETIVNAVTATNQTYVEALKAQGKFDLEAQKEAFKRTYESVITILGAEATVYLTEAVGDLNTYITQAIERQVNIDKLLATTNG